ncbi:translation initiation factor Sui1 [Planctomycetes bacterium MalM25]|nr:translation initiation factor Sui1 [Planctomycetes bacterium MalM25]
MGLFDGTPLERPVTCDRCDREETDCQCPPQPAPSKSGVPLNEQSPRVRRERRRGKWNTVVSGIEGGSAAQKTLLKELRTTLGAGGGVTNDELILQGDHRDKVVEHLVAMGYRAKAAGG